MKKKNITKPKAGLLLDSSDLLDAIDHALIGGNHIASVLIHRMGGGEWPDDADTVIKKHGVETYDIWCCWKNLMALGKIRDAMASNDKLRSDVEAAPRNEGNNL